METKNNIVFILLLILVSAASLPAQGKVSLAIKDIKNQTGQPRLGALQNTIKEQLKTELASYPELTVVEAKQAQYEISGEYTGRSGRLTITAQVVKTASNQKEEEKVSGNSKHYLNKMVQILAYNIRHGLTGAGGLVETYKIREGWYASLAILSGVSYLTSGVFYLMHKDAYENKYYKAARLDDIERYYNRATQVYNASGVMLAVSAVLTTATTYFWLRSRVYSNYIRTGKTVDTYPRFTLWLPPAGVGGQYHLEF